MSKRDQLPQVRAIFLSPGAAGSSNPLCFAGQPMATSQKFPIVTVILVHGAWADGSSWNEVIARLQAEGVPVVSVQNPLSSLADDVAAVRRAMELVDGPVVLVGHSWGGTVITQSGVSE